MSAEKDTLMNPRIEGLLEIADSKFRLVTLAARRARRINAYFGQLGGEGLGAMVPPQVTSTLTKPLSISFEEIAAHKIVIGDPDDVDFQKQAGLLPEPVAETAAEGAGSTDAN